MSSCQYAKHLDEDEEGDGERMRILSGRQQIASSVESDAKVEVGTGQETGEWRCQVDVIRVLYSVSPDTSKVSPIGKETLVQMCLQRSQRLMYYFSMRPLKWMVFRLDREQCS